jgi:hypothetical protein
MARFQNPPDFATLPPATPEQRAEAITRLQDLAGLPPETIQDQDDRILAMCATVALNPAVFGESGYYLASEIMRACRTIETSEFRRAFMRDYVPQIQNVRKYLHELAALRRRAKRATGTSSCTRRSTSRQTARCICSSCSPWCRPRRR